MIFGSSENDSDSSGMAIQSLVSRMIPCPHFFYFLAIWLRGKGSFLEVQRSGFISWRPGRRPSHKSLSNHKTILNYLVYDRLFFFSPQFISGACCTKSDPFSNSNYILPPAVRRWQFHIASTGDAGSHPNVRADAPLASIPWSLEESCSSGGGEETCSEISCSEADEEDSRTNEYLMTAQFAMAGLEKEEHHERKRKASPRDAEGAGGRGGQRLPRQTDEDKLTIPEIMESLWQEVGYDPSVDDSVDLQSITGPKDSSSVDEKVATRRDRHGTVVGLNRGQHYFHTWSTRKILRAVRLRLVLNRVGSTQEIQSRVAQSRKNGERKLVAWHGEDRFKKMHRWWRVPGQETFY